jgi:DedD protein
MGGGTKRGGGGERVLESRHLVGLFLGVVLLCCVFFTLGYVMGRSQDVQVAQGPAGDAASAASATDDPPVRPSRAAIEPATTVTVAKPADSGEWDFNGAKKSEEQGTAADQPARGLPPASPPTAAPATSSTAMPPATSASAGSPPAQPVASRPVPAAPKSAADSSKMLAHFHAPRIPHGAFVWQIAALTHESDALAMADALQQKKFPAFVLTPTADSFFRVQVGPYADAESAALAKHALEHKGFKPIVKR